jgi:hypothetical protein
MKTISPVTVWYNGQEVQATILSATAQNDNLLNSAMFQYQLLNEVPYPGTYPPYLQPVAQNFLTMTGEAYEAWDTNDYAYEWIAEQLNLTITGNYVPPAPPTPPTPTE